MARMEIHSYQEPLFLEKTKNYLVAAQASNTALLPAFLIPINRSRIKHTCARKKPQTHYVRTSSRYVGPSDGWACCRCQLIWAWDGVGGWGGGSSFLPPLYIQFWRVGHIQHRGFLRGGTASVWEQGSKKGLKKNKINKLSCKTISNLKLVDPYKWESCKNSTCFKKRPIWTCWKSL